MPAIFDAFPVRYAQKWLRVARSLRASQRRATNFDRDVVRQAIAEIEALDGAAMRRKCALGEVSRRAAPSARTSYSATGRRTSLRRRKPGVNGSL